MALLDRLKGLVDADPLLTELRALRVATERIATALELQNAHQWPQVQQPNPDVPPVEVTYVDDEATLARMFIEGELLVATGRPPTEDEVEAEFDRRRGR